MNQSKRARAWAFTLNNHTVEDICTFTQEKKTSEKYCFQEETGKDGTPHLQGTMVWSNAKSFAYVKKVNTRAHWEQCRNIKRSLAYCSKTDTRTGKVYTHNYQPETDDIPLLTREEMNQDMLSQHLEDIGELVRQLKNIKLGV